MSNWWRYLLSFETKGADKLPVDSDTHIPEEKYETPIGNATPWLLQLWNKASSGHGHATPVYYWIIALILGVITLLEVWVFGINFTRAMLVFVVLLLAVMKFVLVTALYMHLRFDNKLYSWVFVACMVLGVLVFCALLALAEFNGALQQG